MVISKLKKIVFSIVLLLTIIIIVVAYNYVYKDHRNISSESSQYFIEVNDLYREFIINQEASYSKYANKTIEIYGTITFLDLENNTIVVNDQLLLSGEDLIIPALKIGQNHIFKGRFVGYDDLLDELRMDQCILIKN
jgi:hypothetical protein